MQLAGTVALLTGGKRIGAVIADSLARQGVDVALGYARSQVEAERTVAEITALGRRAVSIHADLSRPEACAALVAAAATALGRLDILINMASVYVQHPFDELDERGGTPVSTSTCAPAFCAARRPSLTCACRTAGAL